MRGSAYQHYGIQHQRLFNNNINEGYCYITILIKMDYCTVVGIVKSCPLSPIWASLPPGLRTDVPSSSKGPHHGSLSAPPRPASNQQSLRGDTANSLPFQNVLSTLSSSWALCSLGRSCLFATSSLCFLTSSL